MADAGTEFLVFLKANYPEDFAKVSRNSVSDATVNTIFAKHHQKFDAWRKVPEWLRSQYNNRVPDNILKVAQENKILTPEMVNQIEKISADLPQPASYGIQGADVADVKFTAGDIMAIATTAKMIAAKGYAAKTAQSLAADAQVRQNLLKKCQERAAKLQQIVPTNAKAIRLTPAEQKLWQQTRRNDLKSIKKDWIENQPERYAVHLIKQFNAGKIDKDKALPELDILFKKVKEQNRVAEFHDLMQTPQAGTKRYTPATKELVGALLVHNELISKNKEPLDKVQSKVESKAKEAEKLQPAHQSKPVPEKTAKTPQVLENQVLIQQKNKGRA